MAKIKCLLILNETYSFVPAYHAKFRKRYDIVSFVCYKELD